ncbi:MAG: hypothetical protein JWN76_34 [Chitinophagaceae bacterium]|nr:hypothetical protein [Chitinophagaceae bacterium]
MNANNLEYLQKQLLNLGFGEGLNKELERQMKTGMPDFQLATMHEFGKDKMEAVLHFKKSEKDGNEMYFFNKYDATLKSDKLDASQTFFINNKGQSITFKEACNLMNGRCVHKEITPKEGEAYKTWVKLDFSNRDDKGNAKFKHFNENFGFDVKEALGRLPFKELSNPEQMETLIASLKKGNMAKATLIKDRKEQAVFITADPQFKTLKMYDKDEKKLYVPSEKMNQRYGLAPTDERKMEEAQGQVKEIGKDGTEHNQSKEASMVMEPGASLKNDKKKDLLPKKTKSHNLLPKKNRRKGRGQSIG